MTWSQVALGHFQRNIGENETFIKIIGDSGHPLGHEHWAINADASFHLCQNIAPDILLQRFEDAWKVLRFKHPSIAAIASATHIDYKVPNVQELQQWSSETFVVNTGKKRADVAADQKPMPFAVLHVFPGSNEVLLHTAHWRTDGIGVLQLLNAFFELVSSESALDPAGLPWGQETVRLAPSVEDAASIPLLADAKILVEADKWTETFHQVVGAVGIECSAEKGVLPAGTRAARSSLSESATEAIIQACKARGISVTSAVHAALASTNWAFGRVEERSKHYTSTIRAALRPYLPEPYRTPAYASGLYTSGYMHSLPAGQSFAENARQLNELYRRGLSGEFLRAHRQYALNLQNLIRNAPADAPSPSDVDISSVGILDDVIQSDQRLLQVIRVSVGVEILTRQMVCFVWTFRGKLSMNLVYNEAFYGPEVPIKFLEKLEETLKSGLLIRV